MTYFKIMLEVILISLREAMELVLSKLSCQKSNLKTRHRWRLNTQDEKVLLIQDIVDDPKGESKIISGSQTDKIMAQKAGNNGSTTVNCLQHIQ